MSQQFRLANKFAKKLQVDRIARIQNAFRTYKGTFSSVPSDLSPRTSSDRSETEVTPPTSELNTTVPKDSSWENGRRIVELGHMAKQMLCGDCGKFLHLRNIVHETRHGFGSILMIECECGIVSDVTTGKTHRVSKTGPPVFDVNTKAALGMVHSGTGHTQLTNFMAALEIEGLHHSTMKKREREVEPHIQSVAKESCTVALAEEAQKQQADIRLSDVHVLSDDDMPRSTPGQFKYDMGWQKRGSGRAYDSKSGVGTLIGNQTGKICAYGIRTKDCRMCSYHSNRGQVPPEHNCKKNWAGSSKAMESSVAVDVVKEVEKENVEVSVLIMDDDATTMAHIRDNIAHPVSKWSDMNHTKQRLGNSLYSLQSKHKNFTNKCVQSVQKCFSYAVAQNKNNPDGLKSALSQIVPHAFGEHDGCNSSWCGYLANPDTYKHKSFPYGRDLTGEELRKDLNIIFELYISNVEKIAPAASTKDVESFNNIIASKAPKRIHYSGSSSLHNRLNCAVAEKNFGSKYVNKVNSLVGLSPGKIFEKHAERKDKTRKRIFIPEFIYLYENTRAFKKHKLERKVNKNHANAHCELREGITYQSSVDLTDISTSDTLEIPAPRILPDTKSIELPDNYTSVYCDIETTSLGRMCDIVQIAATSKNDTFSQYILPTQPIAPSASAVTGLKMCGNSLFLNDNPVSSTSLKEALVLFLSWLDERKPCVLIGHNFKQFDFPRMLRAFDKCCLMSPLAECAIGIVDTLPLFRQVYPGLDSYKQEYLMSHNLNEQYSAHDAEQDVISLQKLFTHSNPPVDVIACHSASVSCMVEMYHFDKETDVNLRTFCDLYENRIITKNMCIRMARSGLQLKHLIVAFKRGCLCEVLLEKVNGKPRVTSSSKIIEQLSSYLSAVGKDAESV